MVRWYLLALVPLAVACGASESDGAQPGGFGGGQTSGGGGGEGAVPTGDGGSGFIDSEAAPLEPNVKTAPSVAIPNSATCDGFTAPTQLDVAVADARGMASGPRVRELIAAGSTQPAAVRTSEINNYYRLSWPNEQGPGGFNSLVALRPRAVGGTVLPGHYDLLVALRADPTVHLRQKVEMVVVADTSSWMTDEGLARARKVVRALANSIQPNDYFAVKSVSGTVLFDSTESPPSELADIEAKIVREDGGSVRSAVEGALTKLQESPPDPAVWKRVVLVGNGGSGDSPDLTTVEMAAASEHRVFVSAVGVGTGKYNGGLLAGLARSGRGAHLYIDSLEEPAKLIEARFVELFGMAADDVRFAVSLPWFVQSLDPKSPPDNSSGAPAQYLSPGGTMLHVFRLFVCEAAIANASELIAVDVSYVMPGETTPKSLSVKALKVTTTPSADAPKLDELDAIDAWVSAFRSPSTTRYLLATKLLDPVALPGAPFDELRGLLAKHPNASGN